MSAIALVISCLFWSTVAFTIGFTMAKGRVPRPHWRRPFIR